MIRWKPTLLRCWSENVCDNFWTITHKKNLICFQIYMCVGPVTNCWRYLSPTSSQNISSIAWLPVPKETGKSVDQSIESKLKSPTKTVRLDLALLRRVQMMKNLRWRTRRAIKVYKITGKQFSVLISTTISSAFSFSRSKRRKACRSVSIANNTPPPTLPSQPLR